MSEAKIELLISELLAQIENELNTVKRYKEAHPNRSIQRDLESLSACLATVAKVARD